MPTPGRSEKWGNEAMGAMKRNAMRTCVLRVVASACLCLVRCFRGPARAVPDRRDHHRESPRRDESASTHVPPAGGRVPAAHRDVRQERAADQRDRPHQSRRAERSRRSGSPLRVRRPDGPAALRADDRQGQLRDDRPAERGRIARAQGLRVRQGRVPGEAHQGRRRDRARQVEHGGVRVQPVRDGELAPRHDAEPVRV